MKNEIEQLKEINVEVKPQMALDIFSIARRFHNFYEEESKIVGWKTQDSCKVEFDDLPQKNKFVMLRTCAKMIEHLDELSKANTKGTD